MELFKGYVPTDDKHSTEKFKDRDLRRLEQVRDLPEYAGILGEDTILVDVDDREQSEIVMDIVEEMQLNCLVNRTTRGLHFLFKRPADIQKGTLKVPLAIGITDVDTKVGCANSYEVLKFNGREREVEWEPEVPGEYDELPCFLRPVRHSMGFLTMEAGSGRNQALFNYILTLQGEDFTVEQVRQTIRLINSHVLEEPLPASEVETILRDDAFSKEVFFSKGKFLFDRFARYLRSQEHVVKIGGQLHVYRDGIYVPGDMAIEAAMIHHIPGLTKSQRREVMDYLRVIIERDEQVADANLIAFSNGIYNLATDSLEPYGPATVVTNRIGFPYEPGAYSELMDGRLDSMACHDPDIRAVMEELIGYCLYRRNELGKAFILTGERNNGKSTFLDVVKYMLGEPNISALDLKELGDRFSSAMLFGKLANIGDDISDDFLRGSEVSIFKKIVTGNRIKAERKGQDPFEFEPYSKLLFSANDIPRMRDKTGAVIRRLVIVPFNARYTPDDPDFDPYVKYKLCQPDQMPYLIRIGIAGLRRVLEAKEFTMSSSVRKEMAEYEIENNPLLLFLDEVDSIEILNEPTKDVYRRYSAFCSENNYTPMANTVFSKQVNKRLGFTCVDRKVAGRKVRCFAESRQGGAR